MNPTFETIGLEVPSEKAFNYLAERAGDQGGNGPRHVGALARVVDHGDAGEVSGGDVTSTSAHLKRGGRGGA